MDISTLASYLPAASGLGLGKNASPPLKRAFRTSTSSSSKPVDLLILGAGWTADFLIPLLRDHHPTLSYASTTRSGGGAYGSIPFTFDPSAPDGDGPANGSANQWRRLPDARTVLVSFPVTVEGGSRRLVEGYIRSRQSATTVSKDDAGEVQVSELAEVRFVQLGSTGIFSETARPTDAISAASRSGVAWFDRHGPIDANNSRGRAESEFLSLSSSFLPTSSPGSSIRVLATVFNLAGLHGGSRIPRNWLPKVLPTKAKTSEKGSLHLVHGLDVARAIVAATTLNSEPDPAIVDTGMDDPVVTEDPKPSWRLAGQRWLLTDQREYDWWELASAWTDDAAELPWAQWVQELMREEGMRALPRDKEMLGRCLDSREFWEVVNVQPVRAGIAGLGR